MGDDLEEVDQMRPLLKPIKIASKQVNLCMEDILKAKNYYLEKEKEAYEKLDDIRRELLRFEKEREEQTPLTINYIINVYETIEKLRLCTHGVVDILLPVMKCGEQATMAIEEEKQKLVQVMQEVDKIHARMIPYSQKYINSTSIEKLELEVKQRHKEQIEKEQEANWKKYIAKIENAKTDICRHYDTETEKDQDINANWRCILKEAYGRFDTEINKKGTEIWEKYREEINKIEQQTTDKCNSKIDKCNSEIGKLRCENLRLRENLEKVETSWVPKLEKDYREALEEAEDKTKQHSQERVQDLKNKFDTIANVLQLKKNKRPTEERKHEMKQEIQDLQITVEKLQKENVMLNVTVDEKFNENLRLGTELQIKENERITFNKTVKALQKENDELRKEIIDKHILIYQANKTLSRSKSLCDLSYSEEEIKNRSKLLQRMSRETNEQQQQILKDQAETVYDYTGKSQSLQSLTQNFRNDFRLQTNDSGMFDSTEDLTEREMTSEDNFIRLSESTKTTTTVQNTYNLFNSRASFQTDCLVEAFTATANTNANPSVTND